MKTDHPAAPIGEPAVLASSPAAPLAVAPAADVIAPTARDVQRQTLDELIRLATECTTLDAKIEKRLADQTLAADKRLRADHAVATASGVDRLAASQQSRGEALEKLEHDYRNDRRVVEKQREDQQRKISAEYDNASSKIKKEFQDATWLVDSILDTAVIEAHKAHKAAMEKTAADRGLIDEGRDEGLASLHRYGQQHLAAGLANLPARENVDAAEFEPAKAAVEADVRGLNSLFLARLFVGAWPFLVALLVIAAAVAATQPWKLINVPNADWKPTAYAGGAAVLVVAVAWIVLSQLAGKQVRRAWEAMLGHLATGHAALDRRIGDADFERDAALASAKQANHDENDRLKRKFVPLADRAKARRDELTYTLKNRVDAELTARAKRRDADVHAAKHGHEKTVAGIERDRDAALASVQASRDGGVGAARAEYEQSRGELQHRWDHGLAATRAQNAMENAADSVRVGSLTIDLAKIAAESGSSAAVARLAPPPPYDVPAWLSMPRQASLLIEHDRTKRDDAIELLRATMFNLLTTITPGRVKFTLVDPVGLGQSFAGFMHLADYDDSLVGGRIWSEADDIEQRLSDLTEHMETVIQKYLRNEFHTIDEYNEQAGELAEPYRFCVIADLPTSFTDESLRRLANIAASGARCGVYVLVSRDLRVPIAGTLMDDLRSSCTVIKQADGAFKWQDAVFGRFAFTPTTRPGDEAMTAVLHDVGRRAKENKRIAVPFDVIKPQSPEQFWSLKTDLDVGVQVGRTGATRLQTFRLGRGVAQHALIAGKTGSGKSTLLNVMITNLAMWYPPHELELYLIDFKRGVEFKAYATQRLPHARAIAVESDREFGLSVLQRLDAEIGRRGEIYRQVGAQDVASYRKAVARADAPASLPRTLPRILLIVDEFQEMFTEDDRVSQEAATLYDRLVRQGRAFGIHVVLGSQTIGGSTSLPRTTLGQMAVRVALQTTEADSQLILGDTNSAARLLTRPGEAIYNDAGGAVENNSPFQISWLNDEERDAALKSVRRLADERNEQSPSVAVFEGNAPAELANNRELAAQLARQPTLAATPPVIAAAIGEAVAIKPPTSIALRRRAGSNVLLLGQQDEQALAVLATLSLSASAQTPTNGSKFYVLDATPADSAFYGKLANVVGALPQPSVNVGYRDVPTTIAALADELKERQASDDPRETIFVIVNGLQRYRELRKTEESFSFSMDDSETPKPQAADKAFAELIKEGPSHGIHVIAWIDTVAALDRTVDRNMLREFDHRVLFQMSATDSAHLIDSPAANKLGVHRAIYFSEEQGVLEKFRPYGVPETAAE